MIDPDPFDDFVRAALPPIVPGDPARDLWPRVVHRIDAPPPWSWGDAGLAAIVALALLMFPEGLYLLAFHF
jgi:hypothetical protein